MIDTIDNGTCVFSQLNLAKFSICEVSRIARKNAFLFKWSTTT
ncbi:hypothetical protein Lser_V15G20637 [Lactuca serriola]